MTRTPALRFVLLLVPVLALARQTGDTQSGDKSLILALESAWNQAEIHHDANAATTIMADTFISVDHHGKLLNKSQYLADLKDLSFSPTDISNSETVVYVYGDTAIVSSAYRTRGTDSGKPFTHHGRFTDTWIKRDGKWLCVANQETLIN
ncbi:MAG TPA: nuclear transport factor 2 family protein [Candidatus Dormibacteraeota bacterium]|nr:nuclear transport factor 2 family protein [Candidatus Dormibacteraeota bacterium]